MSTRSEREMEMDNVFHYCKDLGLFNEEFNTPEKAERELARLVALGRCSKEDAAIIRKVTGWKLVTV